MLSYPGTNCQIHRVGKDRNRKKIKIDYKFRHCVSCGERKRIGAVVATTYNKILHNYCEDCYILYIEQFKGIEKLGHKLVISRNIKKKEKDRMTEIIWTYDTNKATERSKSLSKSYKECFKSLSDKEIEDIKNDDKEYLESLSDKEREELSELTKFREENREKWERERQERIKKYDGGTIIASKSIEVDNGFSETKDVHIFTAVLKNGKIGIFLDDGMYEDCLFCDYLRNEDELDLFFGSIDIRSEPIDGDCRKIQYQRNAEHIYVCFGVEEIINDNQVTLSFSDGMWFSDNWKNEENYIEWSLDTSASDRDTIIKEVKDYMEKEKLSIIL